MNITLATKYTERRNGIRWEMEGKTGWELGGSVEETINQIQIIIKKYNEYNTTIDVLLESPDNYFYNNELALRFYVKYSDVIERIRWKNWLTEGANAENCETILMKKFTKREIRKELEKVLKEYNDFFKDK